MMKGQCIPRLKVKSNSCSKNRSPTPMTLLERFRGAVLRLMMLSALSKATMPDGSGDGRLRRYYPHDAHHSEAVADCIEFIKIKAAADKSLHSTASSSVEATSEHVIPVNVI